MLWVGGRGKGGAVRWGGRGMDGRIGTWVPPPVRGAVGVELRVHGMGGYVLLIWEEGNCDKMGTMN